ncbi:MAG: hypothetical protein MI919_10875 [Holophagales bacterium]|nr:hypothetical protein [Holophagales bacterium]
MIRFVAYALPLLLLLMAVFGLAVDVLDLEPRKGSVVRLALFEQPRVPALVVLGAWTMEACGLLALFLLAQGRCGAWWLDGLVAGWLGWVFRGPLLVMTIVLAARQPQDPWWRVAFAWWILYSVCGLALAILARRSGLGAPGSESEFEADAEPADPAGDAASPTEEPPADESPIDEEASEGGGSDEPASDLASVDPASPADPEPSLEPEPSAEPAPTIELAAEETSVELPGEAPEEAAEGEKPEAPSGERAP